MKKSILSIAGLAVVTSFVISCSDDSSTSVYPPREPHPDDALRTFEYACSHRDLSMAEQVLDPEFIFTFDDGDHGQGYTPELWGRAHETAALRNLFDRSFPGPHPVVRVKLEFDGGTDVWEEIDPPEHDSLFAGESWLRKTVSYDLRAETATGMVYVGLGLQATILLRPHDDSWKIVRWQDDYGDQTAGAGRSAGSGAIEATSWGLLKDLYSGDPGYQDLNCRDDVLINLDLSYNNRNYAEFEKLLDNEFLFYFSEADHSGGQVPISWDRAAETAATTNLFDPNLPGPLRATGVYVHLSYPAGEWTSVPVIDIHDPDLRTWYSKEVVYNITVQTVSGVDYKGNNLKAQFLIRQVEIDGKQTWQIVLWRDIGYDDQSFDVSASSAVLENTWGLIKALYQ